MSSASANIAKHIFIITAPAWCALCPSSSSCASSAAAASAPARVLLDLDAALADAAPDLHALPVDAADKPVDHDAAAHVHAEGVLRLAVGAGRARDDAVTVVHAEHLALLGLERHRLELFAVGTFVDLLVLDHDGLREGVLHRELHLPRVPRGAALLQAHRRDHVDLRHQVPVLDDAVEALEVLAGGALVGRYVSRAADGHVEVVDFLREPADGEVGGARGRPPTAPAAASGVGRQVYVGVRDVLVGDGDAPVPVGGQRVKPKGHVGLVVGGEPVEVRRRVTLERSRLVKQRPP